jgi:Subtilase family
MDGQSIQSRGFRPDFLWRNDRVVLTFHSQTPLFSAEGVSNGKAILDQLNLNEQLPKLNSFLRENNRTYTLSFFDREDVPRASAEQTLHAQSDATDFIPPPGVFLFDVSKRRIKHFFSAFDTNVVVFFKFAHNQGAEVAQDTGLHSPGDSNPDARFVADFVNLINDTKHLEALNQAQIQISAASPDWAAGATPSKSEGCPITPPMPVEDTCSLWSIQFPQGLIPQELNSLNGEGVTVFILDALPDRDMISTAAAAAGDANQLLVDVDSKVTFNYDFSPPLITGPDSEPVSIGKDVFGHHSIMQMPDHGLFVAGIVHDVAPGAQIECIRVLDEYCVGDTEALINALNYIASRMVDGGDLHGQPVVINTSLILPQEKYAQALGLNVDTNASDTAAYAAVLSAVQNVTGNGAILVGSAGNDADIRNNPDSLRHGALYPAGFANDPYDIAGVIPVGAVQKDGTLTSYSGYPGPHGVATFGGEVPVVTTSSTDGSVTVDASQAVRGIYSATTYPPLVTGGPSEPDPNNNGWAYWVGTSFATPIISGLTARVLQQAAQQAVTAHVRDSLIAVAGSNTVSWDRLDSASTGVTTPTIPGPVIQATQVCVSGDTGTSNPIQ